MTSITGTLHEDQYTFLIISRSVLLRMRNVSDKSCRENQNTLFILKNRTVMRYGKMLYSGAGHGWHYGACALHAG